MADPTKLRHPSTITLSRNTEASSDRNPAQTVQLRQQASSRAPACAQARNQTERPFRLPQGPAATTSSSVGLASPGPETRDADERWRRLSQGMKVFSQYSGTFRYPITIRAVWHPFWALSRGKPSRFRASCSVHSARQRNKPLLQSRRPTQMAGTLWMQREPCVVVTFTSPVRGRHATPFLHLRRLRRGATHCTSKSVARRTKCTLAVR